MIPQIPLLLPQTILMFGGCLFLIGGLSPRGKRLWGPACLLLLFVCGLCLAAAGGDVDGGSNAAPLQFEAKLTDSPSIRNNDDVDTPRSLFVADTLAMASGWCCLGAGLLFALCALDGWRSTDVASECFGLMLLCLSGVMLVGLANDLVVMYLGLELAGLPVFALLRLSGGQTTPRTASTNFLLLGILSSALLLYGFSLLYGLAGTTNLGEIQALFASSDKPDFVGEAVSGGSVLGVVVIVLIVAGLGFRVFSVPFHFGMPDICETTTTWNAGFLAVVFLGGGFVALIRLLAGTMAGFEEAVQLVVLVLAGLTMSVGNMLALFQKNVRRMLAYATIGHAGFALVGVAAGLRDLSALAHGSERVSPVPDGIAASLFFLVGYLLAEAGLFAVLIYLARKDRQIEFLEDLAGLIRAEPLAATSAGICLLSLAGIPPLAGFWGRFFLLTSALSIQAATEQSVLPVASQVTVLLGLVMAINLLLSAAVCLRIAVPVFFANPVARLRPSGGEAALGAAMISALILVGIGLMPGPLLRSLDAVGLRDSLNQRGVTASVQSSKSFPRRETGSREDTLRQTALR
jgi:NADH-quinone oxidoreductase subunit N